MSVTNIWQGALVTGLVGILTLAGVITGNWSTLVMVPGVVVALVLTRRVPENRTGWWLLVGSVSGTLAWVCGTLGESERLSLDARTWVVLMGGALGMTVMTSYLGMTPLVFPTGRPFSIGLQRILLATYVLALGVHLFTPTLCLVEAFDGACAEQVVNPIGIPSVPDVGSNAWPASVPFFVALLCASTLVPRYLRARGTERQQIKWVAAFAGYIVLVFIPVVALMQSGAIQSRSWIADALFGTLIVLLPVTIAIAVLKYRLYDIDRLINRAAVYAVVVVLLGAVFVTGAVWLPSTLPFEDNNLAVAVSTLAVFFLFNPLRLRVQRFVDRRFYRSRYDAQRVADDLMARLRDEVDPDAVADEWVEVVQRTLRPAAVSVWVREEA